METVSRSAQIDHMGADVGLAVVPEQRVSHKS